MQGCMSPVWIKDLVAESYKQGKEVRKYGDMDYCILPVSFENVAGRLLQ